MLSVELAYWTIACSGRRAER